MKKNSSIPRHVIEVITILLTITGGSVLANPSLSWVRVKTDKNGYAVYVDRNSIETRGRFRYFHAYFSYPRLMKWTKGQYTLGEMSYESIDCPYMKEPHAYLGQQLDANFNVIDETDWGKDGIPQPQFDEQSLTSAMKRYVCSTQ